MSILPALSEPSNAYHSQHVYVLQSLAQVKSIVLVTDIPSPESLMIQLFTSFFDILSGSTNGSRGGEPLSKNVEYNMTAVLIILVDEASVLPQEIIDTIVAQFLRTDPSVVESGGGKGRKNGIFDSKQSTLVMKELPPAYNMAKTVCNSCPDKMAREISKYFNDVIVDASFKKLQSHRRGSGDLDDLDGSTLGPTEEDLKELYKAHRLLRELWRASPTVLQQVIPQLEAELSAENVQLRLLATETLGDIVSGIGAAGPPPPPLMDPAAYPPLNLSNPAAPSAAALNLLTAPSSPQPFPQAHAQAYTSFLNRRQDRSLIIRAAWTTAIGRILSTSAGGVGLSQSEEERLVADLARMLNDADEKVRIAAVKAVGSFSLYDVLNKLSSAGGIEHVGSVLANLAERVRDKKHAVRAEAMMVLARLWGVAAGEIAAGNERVIAAVGAAPSRILNAQYANDMDINVLLDHVLFEHLLPLSYPPIKAKATKLTNGSTPRGKDRQTKDGHDFEAPDLDRIRMERILLLLHNLDEKAKKVFLAMCSRQTVLSKYIAAYLETCELYNVSNKPYISILNSS